MGSSERLACFTIERRVFCCASSLVLCRTYVNAQVPASVNVVESARDTICGYVYLVFILVPSLQPIRHGSPPSNRTLRKITVIPLIQSWDDFT